MTKVMIVEDETLIAMRMRRNLELQGYDICALATNGAEALQMAAEHRPDVILMDIHLPGDINGDKAAQTIHEQLGIPIIFLSGYSQRSKDDWSTQVSLIAHLSKPIPTEELTAAIDQMMAKSATKS